MKWVTRERPKIDRVACPWLVSRFIDNEAEFLFVPAGDVKAVAQRTGAIPYDVEGVELSHEGPLCSFDAFLTKYQLEDRSLQALATIVRGADTDRLDIAPQCAGLLAVSLGLSRLYADDHEQLQHGFVIYDALYAWLREARDETHTWNPQRQPTGADRTTAREERIS
ncbi:MAG TPA: chromate resistance protein ChrB domain-containing protein [Gemmatimonadaceae bacterium]|nr:chromate resistance protein ChrB domain-containing protein [Gemmatimonadaceae bacterium]